jgi:hypothetical protein
VLSQLVLTFIPDQAAAMAEMARVCREGAVIAACVWDYREGMTLIRAFWDAAIALDEEARGLDEGVRMHPGTPDELADLWRGAGLGGVETAELTVSASYADFEDLWRPLPDGVGPAGAYCASLAPEAQERLREEFHARLAPPPGPFDLKARAFAVRGMRRGSA